MRLIVGSFCALFVLVAGCAPAGSGAGSGSGSGSGTATAAQEAPKAAEPKTAESKTAAKAEPKPAPKAAAKAAAKAEPKPAPAEPPRAEERPVRHAGTVTHYMRQGRARIVYEADDPEGSGLDTVEIWVSRDGCRTWQKYAEDRELTGKVLFEAKEEGVYDFTSVGVDKIGNREKQLNEDSRSDFRVIVDRTPPKVTAKAPAGGGGIAAADAAFEFSWEAADAYLGDRPVELQFKTAAATEWRTVARGLPAKGRDRFELPGAPSDAVELRFVARDLAGNLGTASAGGLQFDRLPPVGRVTGPKVADDLVVKVTYEVSDPGPAELAEVSLWITEDRGGRWRKLADAPAKSGEVEIRLPKAGVYGLSLSATDSAGNRLPPPARGAKPQLELSTDRTAPAIEALAWVTRGQVASARRGVEIKWKAADANIGAKPVSVEFSSDAGRTWAAVGANQEAAGSLKWSPPDGVNSRQCLLRLVARDLMGNESQVVSPVFTVDNKPPVTRASFAPVEEDDEVVGPKPPPPATAPAPAPAPAPVKKK